MPTRRPRLVTTVLLVCRFGALSPSSLSLPPAALTSRLRATASNPQIRTLLPSETTFGRQTPPPRESLIEVANGLGHSAHSRCFSSPSLLSCLFDGRLNGDGALPDREGRNLVEDEVCSGDQRLACWTESAQKKQKATKEERSRDDSNRMWRRLLQRGKNERRSEGVSAKGNDNDD